MRVRVYDDRPEVEVPTPEDVPQPSIPDRRLVALLHDELCRRHRPHSSGQYPACERAARVALKGLWWIDAQDRS